MGRVREESQKRKSEKGREEKIRSKKRKSEKVRRKKIQVHGKVGESQHNAMFFQHDLVWKVENQAR